MRGFRREIEGICSRELLMNGVIGSIIRCVSVHAPIIFSQTHCFVYISLVTKQNLHLITFSIIPFINNSLEHICISVHAPVIFSQTHCFVYISLVTKWNPCLIILLITPFINNSLEQIPSISQQIALICFVSYGINPLLSALAF